MMKEMCLVVDENDKVIDSVSKIDCHRGKGIRHRAFSVLIFDSENRLLMQQRSIEKITFPGIWANSCCSHPLDIENENGDEIEGVIHASKRKMFQELGIPEEVSSGWDYNHIGRFEYRCRWNDEWIEHEIDHVLVVRANKIEDVSLAKKVFLECQFFVRIRAKPLVYFDTNSNEKYHNKKLKGERGYVFKKV